MLYIVWMATLRTSCRQTLDTVHVIAVISHVSVADGTKSKLLLLLPTVLHVQNSEERTERIAIGVTSS